MRAAAARAEEPGLCSAARNDFQGEKHIERRCFIHDILDVKILILYVMSLVEEPISAQTIYELCYQDDCLSYFDVQEAIPQLVRSGHLMEEEFDRYLITDKGRETEEITQDAVAFPVKERAKQAVENHNRKSKRDQFLHAEVLERENGDFAVRMSLSDFQGVLMDLELTAPTLQQARKLERAYRKNAEVVYQAVMVALLEEEDEEEL